MIFGLFVLVLFLAMIALKQVIIFHKRRYISTSLCFIESKYDVYFVFNQLQNYTNVLILKSGQEPKDYIPNSKIEKYGLRCGLIRSIICNLNIDAKEIESVEDAIIIKSYFEDNLRKSKAELIFNNPILLEMSRNNGEGWYS